NKNDRVLIPRALQGMEELTKVLDAHKIEYTEIPVYDVMGGGIEQKEKLDNLDCLIFASASGVNAFFEDVNKSGITLAEDMVIACLGEATAVALHQYSTKAQIIARASNVEGLLGDITRYYNK
ncbi:MAG: uroporphyrin-III C-methyltransferase, partial [Herbinix sp.]|nr:uroporphyrin-III C-methyltransferase [Herbinix sp.]